MRLELDDLSLFQKLKTSLWWFVNQRLRVLEEPVDTPDDVVDLPPKQLLQIRDALLAHRELIDVFAKENPFHFTDDERAIIRCWNHLVTGEFYVYRALQRHTIFLTSKEPVVAYGVVSLSSPIEALIRTGLPHLCKAVLLPFKGRIVYDGLLAGYNMTFGSGIRRRLKESYDLAKRSPGIITTLPSDAQSLALDPPKSPAKSKAPAKKSKASIGAPSAQQAAYSAHDAIVELTDAFCDEFLDEEYATLCRKLAGVLSRKRPSPLTRGKPESWAAGIVRVIGMVNFLGDPTQPYHMRMTDIDELIGVSEATGSAKSRAIRNLLKLSPLDPEWTLPSLMDQNPRVWMIQVDGLVVDARRLSRPMQEEAFRKGLIPYIPADRAKESTDK